MNCNSFTFHSYELECSNYYNPIADITLDSIGSVFSPMKTSSPGHLNHHKTMSRTSKTSSSASSVSGNKSIYNLPTKQNLRILTINCRSVLGKKSELSVLLDYVKPDIVCATESWLHGVKPGKPPSPTHIKSSEVFHRHLFLSISFNTCILKIIQGSELEITQNDTSFRMSVF
jgi:hypothetical protein